jgi:hypothetical protein
MHRMTPSFAEILFKLKDLEFEFSSSFLSSAVTLDVVFLHGGDHTLVGGEGSGGRGRGCQKDWIEAKKC